LSNTYRVDVLIVAEKPSVAEAFARYLSKHGFKTYSLSGARYHLFELDGLLYASLGLRGHIFEFDFEKPLNDWRNINPKDLFFTPPVKVLREGCEVYVELLKELAKNAKKVYLALDADSEGESIAFEVMEVVRSVNPAATFLRPWFSTVTENELLSSIGRAGSPNELLANKCFTRMKLDLVIGASFTRLLTLSIENRDRWLLPRGRFLSYGPCQSPVLRLVVDRALERERFKPEPFYRVVAILELNGVRYEVEHVKGRMKDRSEAELILQKVKQASKAVVTEFKESVVTKPPPKPLTTVELEARASRFLNLRSKKTLSLAEELYVNGLISYPRTETEIYGPSLNLKSIASQFLNHPDYGSYVRFLTSTAITPTRGVKDDKAHPPIHPVKPVDKDYLKKRYGEAGWRVYDFIVRHFLATLSKSAKLSRQKALFTIGGEHFTVNGVRIITPNYLSIYYYEKPIERELPPLKEGEEVPVVNVAIKEGQTEPPPYLSEAELLKLMEKYGIGTDATMQDHIHTNIERGYFYIYRKRCIPTPLGKALILTLLSITPEIINPELRGWMEKEISKIATGERKAEEVIDDVKGTFYKYFEALKDREADLAEALIPALRLTMRNRPPKPRRRVGKEQH